MEDLSSYEKLSIRDSARSLKKYGSTSRHVTRNHNYYKHVISSSDTLQGIALKYGVTMEQIRRTNRLWASDSLFLREHLMIPLPDNSNFTPNIETADSNNHSEITSPNSLGDDFDNVSNFLDKIDSSIASTKEVVNRSRGNSEFASKLDCDYTTERKKSASSRRKQLINNNSVSVDSSTTPQTVVMSSGRKLRSSLQRLEKQQDELFEL